MAQLYTDFVYTYIPTTSGLRIIDLENESVYATVTNSGIEYSAVWGNSNYVYVGTTSSGIKYFNKDSLTTNSGNLDGAVFLTDFLNYPEIYSPNVNYLHGNNYILSCCTLSGVNVIYTISGTTVDTISGKLFSGSKKSFITSSGVLYYTSTVSGYDYLDIVYITTSGWETTDKTYSTGYRDFFQEGITLNDFFVTETTASGGFDTVFVATSSGVYVINSGNDYYRVYMTG